MLLKIIEPRPFLLVLLAATSKTLIIAALAMRRLYLMHGFLVSFEIIDCGKTLLSWAVQ